MFTKIPNSQIKPWSIFISLVVSGILLAGCSLPLSISATSTPTPTSIPPSPTHVIPLNTPTTVPPTQTPLPTVTPTPVPGVINFTPGTTAAVETGTVAPGQVVLYTLSAGQDQPMILRLDSPKNDVTLGVFEANGNKLLDPANKWSQWQWILPKTEIYTIQVIGGASTETYNLTVKVAQLVSFDTGATSMTMNGTTVNGYVFSYALTCKAGQTMTVSINVPATTAYLDVFGIATGPLLSVSAKANSWTGALPQTQEYIIEVIPANGLVVNYALTVSVH
jgi:hypothetical protein